MNDQQGKSDDKQVTRLSADGIASEEVVQEFLEKYVRKPYPQVVLAMDLNHLDKTDSFIKNIARFVKPVRSKETVHPDTFALGRSIDLKKADSALRILSGLLREGERPERILGGLRYAWEKNAAHPLEKRKRLKYLLTCDIDIKTGKLKPLFALEKLVISLCGLR